MLAVLLILFNTITVNETVIAPEVIKVIEQRTEEWIAPGYSIAEEIVINPLDYGDAQEDMNGVPRITSFQSFFLDTPEGEKWRVILSFDKKIVVLQEDTEQREFIFDRRIKSIINSKNGRYLLIMFHGDYYHPIDYPAFGVPEWRPLLLDLDTEERVEKSGIPWISYLGNNGYGISSKGDSIYFFDDNLNLLSARYNYMANHHNTVSSFSADGTLFLTSASESRDMSSLFLRAYDNFGNILWDYREPIRGRPKVADNGKLVLLIGSENLSCINGSNGSLLWTQHIENIESTPSPVASRDGLAAIFNTDLSPAQVRENPDRDRYLCNVVINSEGIPVINKALFNSRGITAESPRSVSMFGAAIWKMYDGIQGQRNLYEYQICLFSNKGNMLYSKWETDDGIRLRGHWRNTFDLLPSSIDSSGLRFITAFDSAIHVITLVRTGTGVE